MCTASCCTHKIVTDTACNTIQSIPPVVDVWTFKSHDLYLFAFERSSSLMVDSSSNKISFVNLGRIRLNFFSERSYAVGVGCKRVFEKRTKRTRTVREWCALCATALWVWWALHGICTTRFVPFPRKRHCRQRPVFRWEFEPSVKSTRRRENEKTLRILCDSFHFVTCFQLKQESKRC